MATDNWLSSNSIAVSRRLGWLLKKPDGVVFDHKSPLHRILIRKEGSLVRMFFADPWSNLEIPTLSSGAMSAIDLNAPFDLSPTPYNQAMMLSLLWQSNPDLVYVVGFAGGRIPLVYHHYLPKVKIESTDIDPDVVPLAERFFGVDYDDRQQVHIEDGREYLLRRPANTRYDYILVDAFRGMGHSPIHLGTVEFYQLCKSHLVSDGVVATNLVESDPLFLQKINTMQACFNSVYLQIDRTTVIFGSDAIAVDEAEILRRAINVQNTHQFPFPFLSRAANLKPVAKAADFLARFGDKSEILTDENSRTQYEESLSPDDPLFFNVQRNDPCPCGSGKKFKRCHGRKR